MLANNVFLSPYVGIVTTFKYYPSYILNMVSAKEIPTDEELNLIMEKAKRSSFDEYLLFWLLKKTGRRLGELVGIKTSKKTCSDCGYTSIMVITKKVCPKCKEKHKKGYKKHTMKNVDGKIIWKLGAQVSDFDSKDSSILLYVVKRRKYVKEKNYLDKETVKMIKEFIEKNRLQSNDYMFRGDHFPHRRTIQRHFKKYYDSVWIMNLEPGGIAKKELTVHCLRHWLVTTLRRQGKSYEDISKMFTKHKSVTVMQNTYDHLMVEERKDEAMELVKEL